MQQVEPALFAQVDSSRPLRFEPRPGQPGPAAGVGPAPPVTRGVALETDPRSGWVGAVASEGLLARTLAGGPVRNLNKSAQSILD